MDTLSGNDAILDNPNPFQGSEQVAFVMSKKTSSEERTFDKCATGRLHNSVAAFDACAEQGADPYHPQPFLIKRHGNTVLLGLSIHHSLQQRN